MKLSPIRIRPAGIFETNSSSTHTFVIGSDLIIGEDISHIKSMREKEKSKGITETDSHDFSDEFFGFIFTSKEKLEYIIAQLSDRTFDFGDDDTLYEFWFDEREKYDLKILNENRYEILVGLHKLLEHRFRFRIFDSTYDINYDSKWISSFDVFIKDYTIDQAIEQKIPIQFWIDLFYHVIIDPEFKIWIARNCWMGSDNPISNVIFSDLTFNKRRSQIRFKDNGTNWVYFSCSSGYKLIVDKSEPTKQTRLPDSLDIKITDICDKNCDICSESSSSQGTHANLNQIISFLSVLKPFEVALGGGNPLLFPDLVQLCQACKNLGIIPNITIHCADIEKFYSLFSDEKLQDILGAVGISVHSVEDVQKTIDFIDTLERSKKRQPGQPYKYVLVPTIQFHVVLGELSEMEIIEIAKLFGELDWKITQHLTILFLGAKKRGRGKNYKWKDIPKPKFFENLSKKYWKGAWYLLFDTLAIQQIGIDLIKYSPFYMGEDGTSSFFIDFVEESYAQSSIEEERMKPLTIGGCLRMLKDNQKFTEDEIESAINQEKDEDKEKKVK